jgi:HEAT repeat protein
VLPGTDQIEYAHLKLEIDRDLRVVILTVTGPGKHTPESRYYDVIRHSAITGLAELEDESLAPLFERYTDESFNQKLRGVAITAWVRAAPQDARLQSALRKLANDPDPTIRGIALKKMGELHHADDLDFLREYAEKDFDPNLQKAARDAAETIAGFVNVKALQSR